MSLFAKCRYTRSLIICIQVEWTVLWAWKLCHYSRIVVISAVVISEVDCILKMELSLCADCKVSFSIYLHFFVLFCFAVVAAVRPVKSCSVIARLRGLKKLSLMIMHLIMMSLQYMRMRSVRACATLPRVLSKSGTPVLLPILESQAGKWTRNPWPCTRDTWMQ